MTDSRSYPEAERLRRVLTDKEIGKSIGAFLGMSGITSDDVARIREIVGYGVLAQRSPRLRKAEPAQPASEPRAWTVLHKSGATIWKLLEDKLSADYWRTQGFPVEALYADSPVLEQLRSILANRVDPDWKVLTAARHALALSSTDREAGK